ADRHRECGWNEPAGAEVVSGPHGRDHPVHVDAGWIGRPDRDEPRVPVPSLKLQLTPARNDAGVQTQGLSEPLGRLHGLVRRLAIDMQYPAETENELRPFLQRHARPILEKEWKNLRPRSRRRD